MQRDSRPELANPAKYVRLAALLRQQIIDGTLAAGESAPSIAHLAASSACARQTCGHALRLLEREGLLTRSAGLDYYVTEKEGEEIRLI